MRKIMDEMVIRARDQNKVFVELASARRLSPADVRQKYLLPKGKGNGYIEFDVRDNDPFDRIYNSLAQCEEWFFTGDVDLTGRNATAFSNY